MSEAVRLVIWDLDETFWKGTLTEGGIEHVEEAEAAVRTLATRGIVSSICSKNDFAAVKSILVERGMWEYFVFPSISWEPKGQRVAQLIEAVQLRPSTVMLIDDNPMNLREALHLLPDLQVASEDFLTAMLDDPRFAGKDDTGLTRLQQYKVLERRQEDAASAGADNTEFLRTTDIRVTFDHDLKAHAQRAIELINRTNQLNFTKLRLPENPEEATAAFASLISRNNIRGALVSVRDKYGDYGVVGLYIMQTRDLLHFCFSCRTLHMGIEEWVYDLLGRPRLKVVGDVLTDLFRERAPVDWINQREAVGQGDAPRLFTEVRARGACDLEAVTHYLRMGSPAFIGEFSSIRARLRIRLDHSSMMRLALSGLRPPIRRALENLGYQPEDFVTRLGELAPPGTVILFSNWADSHLPVYRHTTLGFTIPFHLDCFRGDVIAAPDTALKPALAKPAMARMIDVLRKRYEHVGLLPVEEAARNLRFTFARLPPTARVFVLMMNERVYRPDGTLRPNLRRQHLNQALRQVAARFDNITLVETARFIESDPEIQGFDHFDRAVYYRIARHIVEVCERGGTEPSEREAPIPRLVHQARPRFRRPPLPQEPAAA